MNYKLAQLKQRFKVPDRPAEEPVVEDNDNGLAAAISALVQREVQRQTAAPKIPAQERLQNLDRQVSESANDTVPEHLKEFDAHPSSEWPAPPATTKIAKDMTVSLQRGADGKVNKVSIGRTEFQVQRDKAGRAIRMVEI